MVQNKSYWVLSGVGGLGFFVCAAFSTIRLCQINARFVAETGMSVLREFLSLTLGITAGFSCLMVCVWGMMHIRNTRLYAENQLIHAIGASGRNLFLEYWDKTKKQRWLGDAEHIFRAKEGNMTLEELVHPDDYPLLKQQMEDVKRGIFYTVDVRLRDVDGRYRICSFQMIPIRREIGRPMRILGIAQDVDAERKRTQKLIEERNRLAYCLREMCGDSGAYAEYRISL